MNALSRLPILVGTGLLAAAIGAGPARAAVQEPQPPHDQNVVVGYFRNRPDCDWAARAGDQQDRWSGAYCEQLNDQSYHGLWVLKIQHYQNGNDSGWPGHGPGHGQPGGGHGH
jgi:hypothetical protein